MYWKKEEQITNQRVELRSSMPKIRGGQILVYYKADKDSPMLTMLRVQNNIIEYGYLPDKTIKNPILKWMRSMNNATEWARVCGVENLHILIAYEPLYAVITTPTMVNDITLQQEITRLFQLMATFVSVELFSVNFLSEEIKISA